MPSAKPAILCTGPVEDAATRIPEYNEADIDVIPFTTITYGLSDAEEKQVKELLAKTAVVVFTSNNAVRSVASYLNNAQPDWTIFCIGNTTYDLAKKYFGEKRVRRTAYTAKALAETIIAEANAREIIFFCGNLRRNDLPDALRQKGFTLMEIRVYQTSPSPVALEKNYDAVLFFSPSAAESFFSMNRISPKTVLFVIGNTTAVTIRKYANNIIVTGDEPDKNKLISKAIRFLSENSLHH